MSRAKSIGPQLATLALDFIEKRAMPEPNSGCWIWLGSCNQAGYGQVRVAGNLIVAHRVSWLISGRELPHGMLLLHSCDLRLCVNPDHLRLGTYQDNMSDRKARGWQIPKTVWSNRKKQIILPPTPEIIVANVTIAEATGCWLWLGRLTRQGYGVYGGRGRDSTAHRASWIAHRGHSPGDLWVLHKCDTPRCVNPDHLYLGDALDNANDMVVRGRLKNGFGESSRHHKITEKTACEIFGQRGSHTKIAKKYGLHKSTVSRIKSGFSWPQFDALVIR